MATPAGTQTIEEIEPFEAADEIGQLLTESGQPHAAEAGRAAAEVAERRCGRRRNR